MKELINFNIIPSPPKKEESMSTRVSKFPFLMGTFLAAATLYFPQPASATNDPFQLPEDMAISAITGENSKTTITISGDALSTKLQNVTSPAGSVSSVSKEAGKPVQPEAEKVASEMPKEDEKQADEQPKPDLASKEADKPVQPDADQSSTDTPKVEEKKADEQAKPVAAVSTQEAVHAQDALSRLARIQEAVKKAGLGETLKDDLTGTESALRSMVQIRKQADEDSARVWVKIAAERGMYLVNNLRGLAVTREAPTENLRRRAEQFSYNVNTGLINYGEIMEELSKLPVEAVNKGFEIYKVWLQGKIKEAKTASSENTDARVVDLDEQLAWLSVTQKHYEKIAKEKRTDASVWKMDYSSNHSN